MEPKPGASRVPSRAISNTGSLTGFVRKRGPRDAVTRALRSVPRVLNVHSDGTVDGNGRTPVKGSSHYTVQSEVGADIREALALAVVKGGFGLMELRPAHLSLEEIFLQLTTSDTAAEEVAV